MVSVDDVNLDLEAVFVIVVLVTAAWMFAGSFQFEQSGSSLYPQLTSGAVLVLVGALVGWKLLPTGLRERLQTADESVTYGDLDREDGENAIDERQVVLTFVSFVGFVAVAYLVGFLLATAVYVYAAQVYFGYGTRLRRVLVVCVVLAMVALGYLILGIDLLYGYVFQALLP